MHFAHVLLTSPSLQLLTRVLVSEYPSSSAFDSSALFLPTSPSLISFHPPPFHTSFHISHTSLFSYSLHPLSFTAAFIHLFIHFLLTLTSTSQSHYISAFTSTSFIHPLPHPLIFSHLDRHHHDPLLTFTTTLIFVYFIHVSFSFPSLFSVSLSHSSYHSSLHRRPFIVYIHPHYSFHFCGSCLFFQPLSFVNSSCTCFFAVSEKVLWSQCRQSFC